MKIQKCSILSLISFLFLFLVPFLFAQNFSSVADVKIKMLQTIPDFQVNENVGGSHQEIPAIGGNGAGMSVTVWKDYRNGSEDIYAQRYNGGSKVGVNFKVNDDAGFSKQDYPAVAVDVNGNFVVVWQDLRNGNWDIYAQRYSSDGSKQGSNFKINDDSGTESQTASAIVMTPGGGFIVAWRDTRNGNPDIYLQRFESNGNTQGSNTRVDDDPGISEQKEPTVAVAGNGNFVVGWLDKRNNNSDIYLQIYANNGNKQGSNIRVNDDTGIEPQYHPAVAMNFDGSFILVWTDERNGDLDIYGQRFNTAGARNGVNFRVNDGTGSSAQLYPAVAVDGRGYEFVVWEDERAGSSDIFTQKYTNLGVKIGNNYKIQEDSYKEDQKRPRITADNTGNILIVWQDDRNEDRDIYGHRYYNTGVPGSSNLKINDDVGSSAQLNSSLAADANGNFVIVWEDYRTGFGEIYGQRFTNTGNRLGPNFMINDDSSNANQKYPSVGMDDEGNFIVAWRDGRNGENDIYAQYFNAEGSTVGRNFKVNDDGNGHDQFIPAIAMNAGGSSVIVWLDKRNGQEDIYGQRYGKGGIAEGNNFRINESKAINNRWSPRVSIDASGNLAVVWQDSSNGSWDIFLQRFNSSSVKIGTSSKVNDDVGSSNQIVPAVASDNSGNFVVTWSDARNGNEDIYAQRYSANGNKVGINFLVNDDTGSAAQIYPAATVDESGYFIITWVDFRGNASDPDIYAQAYNATAEKVGTNYRIHNDVGVNFQGLPDVELIQNQVYFAWYDTRIEGQGFDIFARIDNINISNTPPMAPLLFSPANTSFTRNTTPTLSFSIPMDTDDNLLHFKVEVSTSSSFSDQIGGSPFESRENTTGFTPTLPVQDGSGTATYTFQTALTDGSYYWRVSAWDGFVYGTASEIFNLNVDTTPPKSTAHSPAKNATNIALNTTISFRLQDAGSGLNQSSITMQVDGVTVSPTISGDASNFLISYTPASPFKYNQDVTISINASDNAGNSMVTEIYYLRMISDTNPPYTSQHSPARGALDIPINSAVVFHLLDDVSGVEKNSITLKIDNQLVTPEISGTPSEYTITYRPAQNFDYQQTVQVEINAKDLAENSMSPEIYSFTTAAIENSAPGVPLLSSPVDKNFINNSRPDLLFSIPADADGDMLHFKIELDNDHNWAQTTFIIESKTSTVGFLPTPPVAQGAGSIKYSLQAALTEGSWWWRVAAWDGKAYSDYSDERSFTLDLTPPFITNHSPSPGVTGVAINTDIVLEIKDVLSGVDSASIEMTVDATKVAFVLQAISAGYQVKFNPPQDFGYEQTISVSIKANDLAGNQLTAQTYSFTTATLSNTAPATPELTSPLPDIYINSAKPTFTWSVPADVNGDALHFKVELDNDRDWNTITQIVESKVSATGFTPTPPVQQGTGSVSYVTTTALTEGSWWWRVSAWDGKVYGNYSTERSFMIDLTIPFVSNQSPSPDGTGVAISTDIILQIKDVLSGVDSLSIEMTINGVKIDPVLTPVTGGYQVLYNPSQDFGYEQKITVTIKGQDRAGNAMNLQTYSFTTASRSNTAPAEPVLAAPAIEAFINNSQPTLVWSVPVDENEDPLHFKIELDNDHDWNTVMQIMESKTNTTGFSPTPPVTPGMGSMNYAIQSPLAEGTWWWRVAAWDGKVYGNFSSEANFLVDLTPPIITEQQPANGATNVPISSNIILKIQDAGSGVDVDKIEMKVDNEVVVPQILGTSASYTLTYNPPTDLSFQKNISVSIAAADRAGNQSITETYTFATELAPIAFAINHTPVATADSGKAVLIQAGFPSEISIKKVMLYYRSGGASKYDSLQMIEQWSHFYQAMIPESVVGERGVQYYIRAENNSAQQVTSPQGAPVYKLNNIQVKIKNLRIPYSTLARIYQMLSLPLVLGANTVDKVLVDDLNQYDNTQWRLFRYQGSNYVEYSSGQMEAFLPGRGYWLITLNQQNIDIGSGYTTPIDSNYVIELQTGWNMIGNPFNFAINWADVVKSTTYIEAPVAYKNQNGQYGYQYLQPQLTPWQGYAVKNLTAVSQKIKIPTKAADARLNKTLAFNSRTLSNDEWYLQLITEAGDFIDQDNYVGCFVDAAVGHDMNDFSEVPPFDQYVSLCFPHPEWGDFAGGYSGDFRHPEDADLCWNLAVATNINHPVKLTLGDSKNLPVDTEVWLEDVKDNLKINLLAQKNFTFAANKKEFRLRIQKVGSIDANENINSTVTSFELYQNYPNPFNPGTQIRYRLAKSALVTLKVYNLNGQEVRTLAKGEQESGIYLVEWDGLSESAEKMPTGIYWLQLRVDAEVQVKKMLLAR
ncbi:Ig-like domain-containing protein [candidate division KSB1 bacterium]|nr:Ig-like domain-containing protein [candidate division KSB1 bacterium]